MARHYYLTRSGRLRRKDNTLAFEPAAETDETASEAESLALPEDEIYDVADSLTGDDLGADFLGDLDFVPLETPADNLSDILDDESDAPVRVKERRVIPVEDVDAIWSFRELDLNSKVLNFLAQKKIPVHFFN